MKNANSLIKSPFQYRAETDVASITKTLRWTVLKAVNSTTKAVQDCLIAGQALNEARAALTQARGRHGTFDTTGDDGFMEFVKKNLPEIHHDTANRWMRAAHKVLRAVIGGDLPEDEPLLSRFDVPVSVLLGDAGDNPTDEQREFRDAWFEFTSNKTIKACLGGVFVDGEDSVRADRAINGATMGGSGGDRKDYPAFALTKLRHISTFFGSWGTMTERQRTEIKDEFAAAICGEEYNLRGRTQHDEMVPPVRFEPWPEDVCEVALEALRARMKTRK